jgi:hypothetical protein
MNLRSWYGLTGEIDVEDEFWHIVKVGSVTLNHPPFVNLFLRRGLVREDRLRLSHLHEFGHFQTLPLALAHVLLLVWRRRAQRARRRTILASVPRWLVSTIGLAIAHQAVWEMASEAYVVVHDGPAYWATYRRTPTLFFPAFWAVMGVLAIGLSAWLVGRKGRGGQERLFCGEGNALAPTRHLALPPGLGREYPGV